MASDEASKTAHQARKKSDTRRPAGVTRLERSASHPLRGVRAAHRTCRVYDATAISHLDHVSPRVDISELRVVLGTSADARRHPRSHGPARSDRQRLALSSRAQ